MKILVIGTGGREHAIVKTLSKSETKTKIYSSQGNPGIAELAECVKLDENNFSELIKFCKENEISLVIVGPEQPLANGLSDALRNENIPVFAPSKAAAQLESSKSFAKNFMQKYNIPTAKFAAFDSSQFDLAKDYVAKMTTPIVIKADGLAGGKGVVIAENIAEAIQNIKNFFDGAFGNASKKIVIEEFMQGEEVSVFAICDGNDFVTLAPSQDHKRIGDNDTGKNTGGMGSYSPVKFFNEDMLQKVCNEIIKPTLEGMKNEGTPFIGCLYVGLMVENGNSRVVEFNVRFGDPETQSVLTLFQGDFVKLLYSAAVGKLDKTAIANNNSNKVACCVILASDGYPEKFETGFEIMGNVCCEQDDDIIVYHSGTKKVANKLVTAGGRVLGITAIGENIKVARDKAYHTAKQIDFANKYYRNDIGKREIERFSS